MSLKFTISSVKDNPISRQPIAKGLEETIQGPVT